MKKLLSSFVALAVLLGISSQAVFAEILSQSATSSTTQNTTSVAPTNQGNGQGAMQWTAGNDPLSFKNDQTGCEAKGFYYDTKAKDCFPSNMGTQNTTSVTPTTQSNGQGATWNFAQTVKEEVSKPDNFGQYLNAVQKHTTFNKVLNELQEKRNNFGQFLNADERRAAYETLKTELLNKISTIKETRKKALLTKFESKTTKKIEKLKQLVSKYETKLANTKSRITKFYQARIDTLKQLIAALEERMEEFKEELAETLEEEAAMAEIEIESEIESDIEVGDSMPEADMEQMQFPSVNGEGDFGQNQQNGQQNGPSNIQPNGQQGNQQGNQLGNQSSNQFKKQPKTQQGNKPENLQQENTQGNQSTTQLTN
jgi:hypothetical protein